MNFEDRLLPWQQREWQQLNRYITQNRVPQALLFSGLKGLGKHRLARQFAIALLCFQASESGLACGQCPSCQWVKAGTHPDLLTVTPEQSGKPITIDHIRQLLDKLSLKPQYEHYRVVIITPSEQLTNAAANAFLKFLEEPGERTILLLETARPEKLPVTIRSRCQQLALSVPDSLQAVAWLREQGVHDDAEVLMRLAQGAPLLALDYARQDLLKLRRSCFQEWMAAADRRLHPVTIAESWTRLPATPLLLWLAGWVIDIIKCGYRLPSQALANPDFFPILQERAPRLNLKALYGLYDLVLTSRSKLDTQLNKQSIFEEILIQWARLNE